MTLLDYVPRVAAFSNNFSLLLLSLYSLPKHRFTEFFKILYLTTVPYFKKTKFISINGEGNILSIRKHHNCKNFLFHTEPREVVTTA